MAPFLAWEMVERGRDSWGVTNGLETVKHLGPILDTFEVPDWGPGPMLFHTRTASCGEKTLENQHPFSFMKADGSGYVTGVHNGGIRNHDELNTKYSRNFEVDSMHIMAHIAEGKPTEELMGYGAVVWFEGDNEGKERKLYFAKFNMYDLNIMQLKTGEVVFCSTETPLKNAVRMLKLEAESGYNLKDDTKYFIELDPKNKRDALFRVGDMKFGSRYAAHVGYGWNGDSNFFHSLWCTKCGTEYKKCKCVSRDHCVIMGPDGYDYTEHDALDAAHQTYLRGAPSYGVNHGSTHVYTGRAGKYNPDQVGRLRRDKSECAKCRTKPVEKRALLCVGCLSDVQKTLVQGLGVCR
jgi:hypothetical protein